MLENINWPDDAEARPTADTASAISQVLREYALYQGYTTVRADTASRLVSQGITVDQLRTLCGHIQDKTRDEDRTASLIGSVLKTHSGWKAYLEDMEFAEAKRAARGGKRDRYGRKDKGPTNQPAMNYQDETLKRDRAFVCESFQDDGKTFEWLCEKMPERSPDLIQLWIDEGQR